MLQMCSSGVLMTSLDESLSVTIGFMEEPEVGEYAVPKLENWTPQEGPVRVSLQNEEASGARQSVRADSGRIVVTERRGQYLIGPFHVRGNDYANGYPYHRVAFEESFEARLGSQWYPLGAKASE
jgi:hypothetical protein